jgi:hypothetical protein
MVGSETTASLFHLLLLEQPGDCRLNEAAREFIEQFLAFSDRLSFPQLFLGFGLGSDSGSPC